MKSKMMKGRDLQCQCKPSVEPCVARVAILLQSVGSNRNFKFKPTREIFESLKFGLDIQTHLWYVVVLEKEA